MEPRWRLEGGEALAAALNALPDRVRGTTLRAALMEAAEPMRATAARLAPYAPGAPDLKANIGISRATRIGSVGGGRWRAKVEGEEAVAVGPTQKFFYGLFQEYGTTRHGAQPFLRPAFDAEAGQAVRILAARLWTALAARGVSRPGVASGPVTGGAGGTGLL